MFLVASAYGAKKPLLTACAFHLALLSIAQAIVKGNLLVNNDRAVAQGSHSVAVVIVTTGWPRVIYTTPPRILIES